MSRFYAELHNGGKPVRRQGHSARGIRADIRGTVIGTYIVARAYGPDDAFEVYATGGSSGRIVDTLIGTLRDNPDSGRPRFETFYGHIIDM